MLFVNSTSYSTNNNAGGVWVLRLSDFPIYQRFVNCYEFARLNKCKIEYIPKANMQLNQFTSSTETNSLSGTLITAIDQIPILTGSGTGTSPSLATAPTWENDGSNDSNITSPAPAECQQASCSYVRGLQGSREKELYKRQVQSFYPAFYTPLLDNVVQPLTTAAATGVTLPSFSLTGCYERNIKKWVNINSFQTTNSAGTTTAIVANNGPLYYGPLYAIDVNVTPDATYNVPLFDVRFTYSISFKRLKGSIATNT